jgi:TM2 domain-containing membrane protein YozV
VYASTISAPREFDLRDTHCKVIGYALWLIGFTGAHRFYYGRPISGTLWFFTFGLFGIGWLVDALLIPSMDRQADLWYEAGPNDYNVCWLLLTFLGAFGAHRLYLGKWVSAIIYLCTAGLFGLGILYDFWTLNETISRCNRQWWAS